MTVPLASASVEMQSRERTATMAAPSTLRELAQVLIDAGLMEAKAVEKCLLGYRQQGKLTSNPADVIKLLENDNHLTKFQTAQVMAGRAKSLTIGKYRVIDLIGSGAMGRVYLGEHKAMRRRVAIKVLPPGSVSNNELLERFFREARAAASLNHRNIVHAYDFDKADDLHYIVMEYVEGRSLQELVADDGPVPWPKAANYIRQAAAGLQHAHSAMMIHRDIKPGNILLDKNGVIKLLDLGLARLKVSEDDASGPLTLAGNAQVLGTADYLAPEQAIDSHHVDGRADIYSLGMTFYYIITGKLPFPGTSIPMKLMYHQTRFPDPIHEVVAGVPDALVDIFQLMIAKRPEERFANAADVELALFNFLRDSGQGEELVDAASASGSWVIPSSLTSSGSFQSVQAGRVQVASTPPPGTMSAVHAEPAYEADDRPSRRTKAIRPKPTAEETEDWSKDPTLLTLLGGLIAAVILVLFYVVYSGLLF